METKICTKCNKEKPICEFVKNSSKQGGYGSHCKECHRQTCINYYQNNKQKYRQRSKQIRKTLINYINDQKINGCKMCGETDVACLDFHHLFDKSKDVSDLVKNESIKTIQAEIAKCIVLCSNCHRKLHYYNNKF